MSAGDNLSPRQFALQANEFDKWAKSEVTRHFEENQVEVGHYRFPPEVGRRVERIRRAREWLVDTASAGAHEGRNTLDRPVHELLPMHTDLVDDWQKSRGAS